MRPPRPPRPHKSLRSRWLAAPFAALGLAASALVGLPGLAVAASQPAASVLPHSASGATAGDDDRPGSPAREDTAKTAGADTGAAAEEAADADAAADWSVIDTGTPGVGGGPSAPVCLGLVPPPYAYAAHAPYYCGDWRLGPTRLPTEGLLGYIVRGYQRTGTLTPVEFLNKYWNPAANGGQGDWIYPSDDGFQLGTDNKPIKGTQTLHVGQKLDRFGPEGGRFLSPAGAPFRQRALPPGHLDTLDPRYPFDYHLYRVAKEFTVQSGPIAAWFEQPGQGVQYMVNQDSVGTIPPNTFVNVDYLVKNGYLVRLN